MRVMISGSTGFIGKHLVSELASDHELICLARNRDSLSAPSGRVEVVECDFSKGVDTAILPSCVDVIIHLAQAIGSFPGKARDLFAINSSSTLWLIDYARRAGASYFIHASSGNVYAQGQDALREDSPCRPRDFYGLTKYVSEEILRFFSPYLNICILRFFVPYGPGQANRMIPNIISSVRDGRPIVLTNGGEPLVNPIYVSDVIRVIEQAMRLEGFHILNVAGPQVVSIKEIAVMAGAAMGREPLFEHRTHFQHSNLIADTKILEKTIPLSERVLPSKGIPKVASWLLRDKR